MRVIWAVSGRGSGREIVLSADHAARVLREAARDLYPDPQECSDFVLSALAPVRAVLVTEGAQSVSAGEPWEMAHGPLFVRLEP